MNDKKYRYNASTGEVTNSQGTIVSVLVFHSRSPCVVSIYLTDALGRDIGSPLATETTDNCAEFALEQTRAALERTE